jgi:hypothetical protein
MSKLLRFTLLFATVSSSAWAGPPSDDYELLFSDEFDGTALDASRWRYREDVRKGGYFNGLNLRQNVSVSGGHLRIAARAEKIKGKLEYTGGGIISKAQFGYGYYECRSKPFMAGKGVHTSFWQRSGFVPNNNIFEIDSYEIDSTQYLSTNNLYLLLARKGYKESPWPHRGHVPFKFQQDGSFLDAYEYTPDGVMFYDNGKVVAKAEWEDLTAAQCVWLTALNGCGRVDESKLPGESTFDYFRYYARDYPGVNLLPNGSFEYNQDKVDAAKPVSWVVEGDKDAVKVIEGGAAHDRYKLMLGRQGKAYATNLQQKLEYIRNGDYVLTARVRRSGGSQSASLRVGNTGGPDSSVEIPACATWTRVSIPKIAVTNHSATISIHSQGEAMQWLEIDDIRFMKPPLPGLKAREPRPFVVCGDPIWSLARKEPITFTGDYKFYFFDRNVGYGDAITVSFVMKPARLATTSPIERIPAKGSNGWAVQLRPNGDLVFRIGSGENHTDVVAKAAYTAVNETSVTCVFERGTASIFIDGKLMQKQSGIRQTTKDDTKAGRLGAVGDTFEAVGDVTVAAENPKPRKSAKSAKFVGTLRDIRIHNRALRQSEIVTMKSGPI